MRRFLVLLTAISATAMMSAQAYACHDDCHHRHHKCHHKCHHHCHHHCCR